MATPYGVEFRSEGETSSGRYARTIQRLRAGVGERRSTFRTVVGIKLIPKLRSTNGLHIEVAMSGKVDGKGAATFVEELNQAISDLGLQSKLNVKYE